MFIAYKKTKIVFFNKLSYIVNMGGGTSKEENKLNNDYYEKYKKPLYNLYDVDTGEILEASTLNDIYKNSNYYFYPTSYCSLVQILDEGFDVYRVSGSSIYLVDNLNYALRCGPCVLICVVKLNEKLHEILKSESLEYKMVKNPFETIYESEQMNRLNKFNDEFFKNNKIMVKNPKNIKIKYAILKDSNKSYDEFQIKCVLNLKSKTLYDKINSSFENLNQFIKMNLWYMKIDFQTVLDSINVKLEHFVSEDGTIKPITKKLTIHAVSYDLISTLTNAYILAAEIQDKNSNIISVKQNSSLNQSNLDCIINPYYILFNG